MVGDFQFRRLLGDAAKNPSKVHYDYIQYSNFVPRIMQIQVATNLKEEEETLQRKVSKYFPQQQLIQFKTSERSAKLNSMIKWPHL